MSWFRRHQGKQTEREWTNALGRYLRAAKVDRAIEMLSGPYGLRRYVVRFAEHEGEVKVTGIEGPALAWGGGPPTQHGRKRAIEALEHALRMLHRNMITSARWKIGAVGVIRDGQGRTSLIPTFDEDAKAAGVASLPAPKGPGHPLEVPEYLRMRDGLEGPLHKVQAMTARKSAEWEEWSITADALRITYPDGQKERRQCQVLATFSPKTLTFAWQVKKALFKEPPFVTPTLRCDYDGAFQLGVVTTTRLQASWTFIGMLEGGAGMLLAAVWER